MICSNASVCSIRYADAGASVSQSFNPSIYSVCLLRLADDAAMECVLSMKAGRSVAQPGSALDWGSRGRGFESRRSDHYFPRCFNDLFVVPGVHDVTS